VVFLSHYNQYTDSLGTEGWGGLYQYADSQCAEGLDPTPLYLEFNFSKKHHLLYLEFNFSEKHEVNSENFSAKNFRQKSLIKFIMIYYHLY